MFRRAIVALSFCISCCAFAQTAQVGANPSALSAKKLSIEYVAYRPARYETELVKELDNDPPNVGGFVSAYLKNRSEAPVRLRFWRLNGKDESHWRVDRKAVWDRTLRREPRPGRDDGRRDQRADRRLRARQALQLRLCRRDLDRRGLHSRHARGGPRHGLVHSRAARPAGAGSLRAQQRRRSHYPRRRGTRGQARGLGRVGRAHHRRPPA
jgi:hypothetical protein